MTFLYDSGSQLTILSKSAYRKLRKESRSPIIEEIPFHINATSAGGQTLDIQKCLRLRIKFKEIEIIQKVYVCGDLKNDALAGIETINNLQLFYDPIKKQVTDKIIPYVKAQVKKKTFIPARSFQEVNVIIKDNNNQRYRNKEICVNIAPKQCPTLEQYNAMVKTDDQGQARVCLINKGHVPLQVPRNYHIGIGEELTEEPQTFLDYLQENDELFQENASKKQEIALLNSTTDKVQTWVRKEFNLQELPTKDRKMYEATLIRYNDVFAKGEYDLGRIAQEFEIPLKTDALPKFQRQFQLAWSQAQHITESVREWLLHGLVEPTKATQWNSGIFCVPKKVGIDGVQRYRVCIDLRHLNSQTQPENFRMPLISECIEIVGKHKPKFFVSLDLASGYYQCPLAEKSRDLTTFSVPNLGSAFRWKVLPFGLNQSPAYFCGVMAEAFAPLIAEEKALPYLDDIMLFGKTQEELNQTLIRALAILRKYNLKLRSHKCLIGVQQVNYLGHEISAEGCRPGTDNVKTISQAIPPTTIKGIRSFLGLCGFFREHVPDYAWISLPLSELLCKRSRWKGGELPKAALTAFNTMKKILCTRPLLNFPSTDPTATFHLYVDGSCGSVDELQQTFIKVDNLKNLPKEKKGTIKGALGAILTQELPNAPTRVIGYASRSLRDHECNYTTTMVELDAAVFGLESFRHFLVGPKKFYLYSDHKPLQGCINKANVRTLNRLQQAMLEFNFEYKYLEGHKHPADFLSRYAVYQDKDKQIDMVQTRNQTKRKVMNQVTPLLNEEELLQLQKGDPICRILARFVQEKGMNLPENPYMRSLSKKYGPNCLLAKNGLLMCRTPSTFNEAAIFIAPGVMQSDLIASAHNRGHEKVIKCLSRIQTQWTWPGINKDVQSFIDDCLICQKIEKAPTRPLVKLGDMPLEPEVLRRCHIDLFGPIPPSASGHVYILTMTCSFSKYTLFAALQNKEARTVAEALVNNWVAIFGSPLTIVSDQGTEFNSKLSQEVYNLLGSHKIRTTAYNPKANSTAELPNKFIKRYLMAAVEQSIDKHQSDWDKLMALLQISYNTANNMAIKMTPFECLYGVHSRIDLFDGNSASRMYYGDSYSHHLANRIERVRKLAAENNLEYKKKYMEYYNSKVKERYVFQKNMMVWLYRPSPGKMNPVWTGPFVILEIAENAQNALIQNIYSLKTSFVHINHIKPYTGQITPEIMTPHESSPTDLEPTAIDSNNHPAYGSLATPEITLLNPQAIQNHKPMIVKEENPEVDIPGVAINEESTLKSPDINARLKEQDGRAQSPKQVMVKSEPLEEGGFSPRRTTRRRTSLLEKTLQFFEPAGTLTDLGSGPVDNQP